MLGVEALVVVHWFRYPNNAWLFAMALAAGAVMTLMAAADVALLVGVLRRDPADPQQRRELEDLAQPERLWALATVCQVAFIAAAVLAGVLWIAVVVGTGQGAELLAMAAARWRTRRGTARTAGAA